MKNMTLRQMRVFAAVARHLSFTKAARELHLTQPAVSQQVKLLEAEVGLPLFEQIGRKVHLAPAGVELLRYTDEAMELLRQASESLSAMRGLKRGVLKLGAVSTAKYFAPSLLSAFTPAYPEVTIKFDVGNREEVIQQLAAKRRIRLSQLQTEYFIIREEGSGTRSSMERVFGEPGVRFRVSMEVSSNETIKQAVMANMGISFLSSHTVGLELAAGKLVILDVVGLPIVRDWYVIHLADKILAPIPAAFRTFLLEHGAGIIQKAVGDLPLRARRT